MSSFLNVDDVVLEAVAKSFDKTVDSLNEDVNELKEWMRTQPHLPEIMDDTMIRSFLIMNKGKLEKTKTKLEGYYSVRSKVPSIFEYSNPKLPIMKQTMEALYFVTLPKLTKEMYRVSVHKVRTKDINNLHVYNVASFGLNVAEIRLKEDMSLGDILIIDCKGLSFKYYLRVTPRVLYTILVTVYQGVFSSNMKGLYALNVPSIAPKILGFLKLLIKPKLFERIHICTESSLIDLFPKEILPKDYGGEEKSLEELQEMTKAKFEEYQDRFDQLDQLRVDESLKPSKTRNSFFDF